MSDRHDASPGERSRDEPEERAAAAGSAWDGFGARVADDALRRRDPVPSLLRVPGWLWRKAPRWSQALMVVLVLVALGFGVRSIPGIERGKEEQRSQEARLAAATQRAITLDQRPTVVSVQEGRATVAELERAVGAGVSRFRARGLIPGPVDTVRCTPTGLTSGARSVVACEARVGASGYAIIGVTDTVRRTVAYCFRRIPAEQSLDVPLEAPCRL